MSKKIFVISLILLILIFVGLYTSREIQKTASALKGHKVLEEALDVDFELVGRDFSQSGLILADFLIWEDRNDSYKFVDENGAEYYTDIYDGKLLRYSSSITMGTLIRGPWTASIEDEEASISSALDFAKKFSPDFFIYDYDCKAELFRADPIIYIRQLNKDGVFNGNYIEAYMYKKTQVALMQIIQVRDPESKIMNEDKIIEIAYQESIFLIDCMKKKLSGEKLPFIDNELFADAYYENVRSFVSDFKENEHIDWQNYKTNINNKDQLTFSAYPQTTQPYKNKYYWIVRIEGIEDNLGSLYSGENRTFSLTFYIDANTGRIEHSSIYTPRIFTLP